MVLTINASEILKWYLLGAVAFHVCFPIFLLIECESIRNLKYVYSLKKNIFMMCLVSLGSWVSVIIFAIVLICGATKRKIDAIIKNYRMDA